MADKPKKTIDDILNEIGDIPDEIPNLSEQTAILPKVHQFEMPTLVSDDELKRQSDKTIKSLYKLYGPVGEKNAYMECKAKMEANSLTVILKQIEVLQATIAVIMDEIAMGDTTPTKIQQLNNTQKTLLEYIKSKSAFLANTEEEAKKNVSDIEGKAQVVEAATPATEEEQKEIDKAPAGAKSKGTRNIMYAIQAAIDKQNGNEPEAEIIEE